MEQQYNLSPWAFTTTCSIRFHSPMARAGCPMGITLIRILPSFPVPVAERDLTNAPDYQWHTWQLLPATSGGNLACSSTPAARTASAAGLYHYTTQRIKQGLFHRRYGFSITSRSTEMASPTTTTWTDSRLPRRSQRQ